MPLKFDKYVNNYTVEIKEDVTKLEIEYICNNDDSVNITNNDNLDFGINYVFIEVINNEEKNVYVLEVYKKRTENVFNEIKNNQIKWGISDYHFYDDNLMINPEWVDQFTELII